MSAAATAQANRASTTPSTPSTPAPGAPDLAAVKARQQGAWSSGDYAIVGTTLYVPALLERGKQRAQAEGLRVNFQEADAEALPFGDASFDAVLSTFGVMFTPAQERAAAELQRVCRPGGRIGLANWTPGGFIGQLLKTLGQHVPPPVGVKSPALWGTAARLQELFGAQASEIRAEPRHFVFRCRSPQHWLDIFRTYYGPTFKAFGTLDEAHQAALAKDTLEVVVTRR